LNWFSFLDIMFQRFWYEFGRCLRETGQALDRVGLRALEKPLYKEPFSRHRNVMNLYEQHPDISPDCFVAPNASVIGNVAMGRKASVWYGAVVRGDMNQVEVGPYSVVGDRAVLHTTKSVEGKPAAICKVGAYVQVGPGAVLQSCIVEDRAKIGAGAVVMEGALVEEYAQVAEGAVVHPGRRIPKGQLWAGNPAVFVRNLSQTEMAAHEPEAEESADLAGEHAHEFLPYTTAYQQAEALALGSVDKALAAIEADQTAKDAGKPTERQLTLEEREVENLVRPAPGLHPPGDKTWGDYNPTAR
jgi:carbonic anhydrase/acetyltransferase-like protein (isoleucine patch superfamily)